MKLVYLNTGEDPEMFLLGGGGGGRGTCNPKCVA